MARLNIEDSIYKDLRFIRLAMALGGDVDRALGVLVRAWSLAQEWYLKTPDRMIPLAEWDAKEISRALIDVGMAEIKGDRVRVRGADEQFGWLVARSKGGKSATRARGEITDECGQLKPAQADSSQALPLTLSPPLSLSLSLTPSQEEENIYTPEFEALWDRYPEGTKQAAFKAYKNQITSDEKRANLDRAITNYLADCASRNSYRKHFSSFLGSVRTQRPWLEWIMRMPGKPGASKTILKTKQDLVSEHNLALIAELTGGSRE